MNMERDEAHHRMEPVPTLRSVPSTAKPGVPQQVAETPPSCVRRRAPDDSGAEIEPAICMARANSSLDSSGSCVAA